MLRERIILSSALWYAKASLLCSLLPLASLVPRKSNAESCPFNELDERLAGTIRRRIRATLQRGGHVSKVLKHMSAIEELYYDSNLYYINQTIV
jgi:hypothetical protein